MKTINLLMSLLFIFAGISAFDIKAAAKQDSKVEDANKMLLVGAETGNIEQVKEALANGADVNARDLSVTALKLASINGHTEIMKLLLLHNPNINAQGIFGDTSLLEANKLGRQDVVNDYLIITLMLVLNTGMEILL